MLLNTADAKLILITFILYHTKVQSSNTCFNFIVKQLKRLQYRFLWSQTSNKLFACWSSSLQTFGKLILDSLASCFTLKYNFTNLRHLNVVKPVRRTGPGDPDRHTVWNGLIKMLKAKTIASEIDELL